MQIINDPGIASRLGTGLGEGLSKLLNQKVQQMQQEKGLAALGLPKGAAGMDPRLLQEVLKNQPMQQQLSMMQQILGGGEQQPEQQSQMQPQDGMQQVASPAPEQIETPKMAQMSEINKLEKAAMVAPADIRRDLLKLASEKRKEIGEEKKEARSTQREIDKETAPVYKEVIKKYKDSRENDQRIGRMERLVEKGNLGDPTFNSFLETLSNGIFGFGINLKSLMSADAQEFDKLSTEFLKGAKELFGARVTDNEIKMFMKMVPTLVQSDAGKMRVISNMKTANQANKIRRDAMRDIIKGNKGKRPDGLEDLIEERVEKRLDRLATEFKRKIRPRELSTESVGFESKVGEVGSMLSPSRLLSKGRKLLGSGKFGEAPLF